MLGSHSAIHAPEEPHLLTPIAHLGYHEKVERAPYDPIITQIAARALVKALPGGESDYLAALRAYTDAVYEGLLGASGAKLLLDKTPAYALVLDFVARLYPQARYVVLTRNPLAVWSSYVESFFDGDPEAAHRNNPLMERYVPAIARFLRERPVALCHVRYEELVADPEGEVRRICDHLDLAFEPGMIDYGSREGGRAQSARGLGDPTTVAKQSRPTTTSVERWSQEMAGSPVKIARARMVLEGLLDEDLATWGFTRAELAAKLDAIPPGAVAKRRSGKGRYALERRVLVRLRRNIHHNAFGRLVRRIRNTCDVLLR